MEKYDGRFRFINEKTCIKLDGYEKSEYMYEWQYRNGNGSHGSYVLAVDCEYRVLRGINIDSPMQSIILKDSLILTRK